MSLEPLAEPSCLTTAVPSPSVIEFNVFLDNRMGRLLHLWEVFESSALSIIGYSVIEATAHAVVRMVASDASLARTLLHRCQYPFVEEHILVLELPHADHLAGAFECLAHEEVNVAYSYPLLMRPRGKPILVVQTNNNVFAARAWRKTNYGLLGAEDLQE